MKEAQLINQIECSQEHGANHSLLIRLQNCVNAIPIVRGLLASRAVCRLQRDTEPQEGAPLFVVVHGTWGRRAAWTEHRSNLMKELAKEYPTAGRYRFIWSATNGVRQREIAAEVLSEELRRTEIRHPSSKIVAIAHSHGGNVVAWASTKLDRPLAGAIYLNTPFTQVLGSPKRSDIVLRVVLFVIGTLVFLPLARVVEEPFFRASASLDITAFFVGLAVLGLGLALLQVIVPRRICTIRNRLMDFVGGTRNVSHEVAAFVVGDEPNSIFGAVYMLQWVGRIVFFVVVMTFLFVANTRFVAEGTAETVVGYIIIAFLAAYFVYILFAVSAYGLVQALIGLDAIVAATPAPIGTTEFITIAWEPKGGFRHSVVHDSPESINAISTWLRSLLQSAEEPSGPRA
jgi:hypothetical protein